MKFFENIGGGSETIEGFTHESGYPYYYVKNKDIITEPYYIEGVKYNKLKITVDDEIIGNEYKEVFKIILRKNAVFDSEGRYIREFIICT